MIALTPKVIPWCCSEDRKLDKREDRTYWMIGSIDEAGLVEINNQVSIRMNADNTFSMSAGTRVHLYVKRGLRGLQEGSHFRDENGNDVQFETDEDGLVSDDYLSHIPWEVKQEMCEAIIGGLKLDEDEKEE